MSNLASNQVSVQEFSIRVPKNLKKKHHVMRFNGNLNVDFTQWRNVKMERENNLREFKGPDEELPKFGAGSEYNRDLKEEVRRKKYGIIAKKYRPEAQPWILKAGGKNGKKFRGIREGGVSDNASFYVFTHAPDGAIEAYPLNEWYNFQPIQRYKTLTAEEAEQELSNRKKSLNLFALMLRKRLKGDGEEEQDVEGDKKEGAKKRKDLTISEMDEWMESDDGDDDSEEENGEKKAADSDDEAKKKKKKGAAVPPKKKKRDVDDEAFEESDDGDEEGRELDYISDSSDSDSELEVKNKELKSVAEEDGLRNLLTSEEEDEEGEKKSGEESNKSDDEKESKKDEKDGKEKKKKKKKKKGEDSSDDFSSDSTESEQDPETSTAAKKKKKKDKKNGGASRSDSPFPESGKRKANSMPSDLNVASENSNSPMSTPAKKPKLELPSSFAAVVSTSSKEDYGITEEAVRKYLIRKPMTTIELLSKFKNKKTGVSSDKLVETMTQILKKINPVKQTIQGKMYLSIKGPK